MLALSFDNLLFILLIVVAALFQLLSRAMKKGGNNDSEETSSELPTPQRPRPIQRAPRESDADRIRKFLEALGQPPTSTAPPPVAPRIDLPPRQLAPVQPPPVLIPRAWQLPREHREKPAVTQRESPPPEQPSRLQEIPPFVMAPAPTAFEVHETLPVDLQQPPIIKTPIETIAAIASSLTKGANFKEGIAILLASKSGLREAMLLREIFGPPRGLQAFDLL